MYTSVRNFLLTSLISRTLKLVKMFLEAGIKVNTKNIDGCTLAYYASHTGNLYLVKTLIESGVDVNIQGKDGTTALFVAIEHCDNAMTLLLLKHGARVDVKTANGNTPLHIAGRLNKNHSHESIIRKLLDFGSDVNCLNKKGITPFYFMTETCNFETLSLCIGKVEMKQQDLSGYSLLHAVASNEDQNVMNLVFDRGIPINLNDNELDMTALHLACYYNRTEYVRQLITRGADVNIKNKLGLTAAFMSLIIVIKPQGNVERRRNVAEDSKKVLRLLLEAGSDLNQKINYRGEQTVLEILINLKDIESINMIIEYSVKVEVRPNKPLFDEYNLALINAHPDLICHYERCRAELEAMKNRRINGTLVRYFSILMEPMEVVARYTRNQGLVKEFEASDYQTAFPIYSSQLVEKIEEAICRRNAKEKILTVLSETLEFAHPTSMIFETIYKYLRQADVDLLIDSEVIEK